MSRSTLVTGAAGFAGSHIARALLERGDRVVGFDLAPLAPLFVNQGLDGADFAYVVGDVTDASQLTATCRAHDVVDVVHTAAAMGDADAARRPRHFLRVNAEAVWTLCDLARTLDLRRLVLMSSRSYYGAYAVEEGPVDEDAAPRPTGFYGASKAAADIVAVQYRAEYALDVVLPRVTGLYGPHQSTNQNILANMVSAAVAGDAFVTPIGHDYRWEVTYVKDVARAALALLDRPRLEHAVYNIGSGEQRALEELADVVRLVVPGADITLGATTDPSLPPRAMMSINRMTRETGFRTAWSIEDGVRELVDWHRTGALGRAAGLISAQHDATAL